MRALKRLVKSALAAAPVWQLAGPLRRTRTVVLAYHRIGRKGDPLNHVDVDTFRRQMTWASRHCRPIAPDALTEADASADRRPRVLVTFDDGYRDYYTLACPILDELRIPAVNFVSTDYIDTGRLFWWDVVDLAGLRSRRRRITLPWPPHTSHDLTAATRPAILRACKYVIACAPDAERDSLVASVCAMFDVNPAAIDAPRQVMTWDEIRATMPLTAYGGHTHTHVRVSRVDPAVLDREIRTCTRRLTEETGVAPRLFAYPIGDGSDDARRILSGLGYEVAFTVHKGYADPPLDWLNVPRFSPATLGELAWVAAGRALGAAPLPADRAPSPVET